MPLKNPRHERFAQLLASGKTATDAYEEAGYKRSDSNGWADQASALGWTPLDLFGCDRERPLVRRDHAGLLWRLEGRKLVALTATTATIETATTGSRQICYRVPVKPGRVVLAWEPR